MKSLFAFIMSLSLASCSASPHRVHSDMVFISKGPFTMGYDTQGEYKKWGDRDEEPVHEVYLSDYWIDFHETTAKDFSIFLNSHKEDAPRYLETGGAVTIQIVNGNYQPRLGLDQYPANRISWYGATAYCKSLGKRLPTEAEWEKAARGVDQRTFPWGEEHPMYGKATFRRKLPKLGFKAMEPVDSLPEGRSPYGLYHMAGNVWEWVNDWYQDDYYEHSPEHNPKGPNEGKTKVLRGGNWYYKAYYLRTTYRFNEKPDKFKVWQGVRCASDATNTKNEF